MDGVIIGVFGTDKEMKRKFLAAITKKSEAEGIEVHVRTEDGKRYSFLDVPDYPGKIQGYACVASIADRAYYLFPSSGRLTAPDGELAVLSGAMGLPGTLGLFDGSSSADFAASSLKGTAPGSYVVEERQSVSASIDTSRFKPGKGYPEAGNLIYVDRAFTVKGVGTVALGFVLFGDVRVHDQLRPIPGPDGKRVDVRGIQVSDVDCDSAGRGIRVGLSLRGIETSELQKSHWLDDGSLKLTDRLRMRIEKSPFYKLDLDGRDLHLQVKGETVPAKLTSIGGGLTEAVLPWQAPVWEGMKTAVLDLNGKGLRVAGGASCIQ